VEAANNWNSGISKGFGQIVSFEYDVTGAFDRTEEAKQIPVQDIKVTDRPNVWIMCLNILFISVRVFGATGSNFFGVVCHGCKVYL
jgi:hypothetical protein